LILGVANDHSIAWSIAQQVMAGGAFVDLRTCPTGPTDERQRNRRRGGDAHRSLPKCPKFLVPLDVSSDEQIQAVMDRAAAEFGQDRLFCCTPSPLPRWKI